MEVMGENSLNGAMFTPMNVPSDDDSLGNPPPRPMPHEPVPILGYFMRTINGQIAEVFHRIKSREARRLDQDMYDPEMEDALREEEDTEDAGTLRCRK
jgi:hypothetical protein